MRGDERRGEERTGMVTGSTEGNSRKDNNAAFLLRVSPMRPFVAMRIMSSSHEEAAKSSPKGISLQQVRCFGCLPGIKSAARTSFTMCLCPNSSDLSQSLDKAGCYDMVTLERKSPVESECHLSSRPSSEFAFPSLACTPKRRCYVRVSPFTRMLYCMCRRTKSCIRE